MPQKVILGSKSMANFPACWEPGLQGICKGERRIVGCPAAMAFGREGKEGAQRRHGGSMYYIGLMTVSYTHLTLPTKRIV